MSLKPPNPEQDKGPHFERLVHIVMDHVFYSKRYPERMKEVSVRMGISEEAALAVVIADQILEEFKLELNAV